MNIDTMGATVFTPPRANEPAQQVVRQRQDSQQPQSSPQENKMQPEELLSQIKTITEDGLYSVRFERDSGSEQLVVSIVDSNTDEIIRQIPPEELLNLTKQLKELSGNVVNTQG
ncbi:flagellar protein FlaG [Desulfobulbus alkaliphilus]|uniref:flagellar protein FlaG n=1 Tax=Desulfobulbus alkaliphilus TaxID=869814 RepID=UPI0019628E30|nr:flagellar protein FlaG [Desulfobulbus alkaliphilus]MBM9537396.1 flagellar protein FlaG [Desulfobulbus alkaliphilus]